MTGVCAESVVGRINRSTRVVQRLNRISLMIYGCATSRWRPLKPRFSGSPTLPANVRVERAARNSLITHYSSPINNGKPSKHVVFAAVLLVRNLEPLHL